MQAERTKKQWIHPIRNEYLNSRKIYGSSPCWERYFCRFLKLIVTQIKTSETLIELDLIIYTFHFFRSSLFSCPSTKVTT
jgi:hypothetical protein